MERGSRTRLATALILAVVFGSGVLLGLAADGSVLARASEVGEASGEEEEAQTEEPERRRRGPIYAQVEPTEAQQERIDSVVAGWRAQVRTLNGEYRPRFDELEEAYDERRATLRQELREGIMAVLTSEQAEEYRRLLEAYDRRQAERREERQR